MTSLSVLIPAMCKLLTSEYGSHDDCGTRNREWWHTSTCSTHYSSLRRMKLAFSPSIRHCAKNGLSLTPSCFISSIQCALPVLMPPLCVSSWIPRHPDLIRLTGKHPFNCEPPLQDLVESGPLTPGPLHYVRNHGYVPRLDWDAWQIEVTGHVRLPMKLTMADLLALPAREIPVTLVCVGNRRKEQNATKQSLGFSWGAAATCTSMWKGARLCDVLRK